jgi:hypothetical protein
MGEGVAQLRMGLCQPVAQIRTGGQIIGRIIKGAAA